MRFLLDNSVSWRVGRDLREAGHDAVHVGVLGLADSPDPEVFAHAVSDARILISQDSDFGPIHSAATSRTGILLLRISDGRPSVQAAVILENFDSFESLLGARGFVILADDGITFTESGAGQP